MDTSFENNFPWELITESISGNIAASEKIELQKWLNADISNKERYNKLKELWMNGMDEYPLYNAVNEKDAWKILHEKLNNKQTINIETTPKPNNKTVIILRRVMAFAAIFIGIVILSIWYLNPGNKNIFYETVTNDQKKVVLTDGSSVTLNDQTQIEVLSDYNKQSRTVIMKKGNAIFDVGHNHAKPFIVRLGDAQIQDIGTKFTVRKNDNEIYVEVATGHINFVNLKSNELRTLTEGKCITLDIKNQKFGQLAEINTTSFMANKAMDFQNMQLSEVILSLQKHYGKKIIFRDNSISTKKITAHLQGMSFNDAMEVICKSLNLKYSVKDSIIVLNEQPKE